MKESSPGQDQKTEEDNSLAGESRYLKDFQYLKEVQNRAHEKRVPKAIEGGRAAFRRNDHSWLRKLMDCMDKIVQRTKNSMARFEQEQL